MEPGWKRDIEFNEGWDLCLFGSSGGGGGVDSSSVGGSGGKCGVGDSSDSVEGIMCCE